MLTHLSYKRLIVLLLLQDQSKRDATTALKGVFVLEMAGYHIGLHADIEDLLGV